MKQKKFFKVMMALGMLFLLMPLRMSAQTTLTPYQRKAAQITLKYYNIFAGNKKLNSSAWLMVTSADPDNMEQMVGIAFLNYAYTHSSAQVKSIDRQYSAEMKAAAKLKNATDRLREFYKTDKGRVYKEVRKQFASWNEKGEFEKQEDYLSRLKDQSVSKFNELCKEAIDKEGKSILSNGSRGEVKLDNYNTEKEQFGVYVTTTKKLASYGFLNIPISEAENFKSSFYCSDLAPIKWKVSGNKMLLSDFSFKTNGKTYTVHSDYLVNVESKEYVPFNPNEIKDIEIPFDKLGISNAYLKGYVYKDSVTVQRQQTEMSSSSSQSTVATNPDNDEITRKDDYVDNTIYYDSQVDEKASFPGGWKAYGAYIDENIITSPNGKRGNIMMTAVVEKDGSISNIKVSYSPDASINETAQRMARQMPKWNPAKKGGQAVRSQVQLYYNVKK